MQWNRQMSLSVIKTYTAQRIWWGKKELKTQAICRAVSIGLLSWLCLRPVPVWVHAVLNFLISNTTKKIHQFQYAHFNKVHLANLQIPWNGNNIYDTYCKRENHCCVFSVFSPWKFARPLSVFIIKVHSEKQPEKTQLLPRSDRELTESYHASSLFFCQNGQICHHNLNFRCSSSLPGYK